MKVLVIGSSGTIGSKVVEELEGAGHDVVKAARTHGDYQFDMTMKVSIQELFTSVGACDAVVCAAGAAKYGGATELSDEDIVFCLANKLMGQVILVRVAVEYVNPGGSITLTSGVLAREPMPGLAGISLVNGAVESFVMAAALDLKDTRINVVSPIFVTETVRKMGLDETKIDNMPAAHVAKVYRESVESTRNGEVLDVRKFR